MKSNLLPIFRSEHQVRLLALLAEDPEREWTVGELSDAVGVPNVSIHRELHRALRAGIVSREAVGRSFLYRIAQESPAFEPLVALLRVTVGVRAVLDAELDSLRGIEAATLHGSWAREEIRPGSDVDLLIVGAPEVRRLRSALARVERRTGRHIDAVVLTPEELRDRANAGNSFIRGILDGPHDDLVGELKAQLA